MADVVYRLDELTPVQGRILVLMTMAQNAYNEVDRDQLIACLSECSDMINNNEAEALALSKKIETLHSKVGCGDNCKHLAKHKEN